MSSQVNFPERRIVLLGKTGVGKSSTANTILGEKRFTSKFSLSSVTAHCDKQQAEVGGRMVSVVDTPGLFDTSYSNDVIAEEIARSVFLSSPGPHALLYVLKLDRFTKLEEMVVQVIESIFGNEMRKYMMILFTCGDQLAGKNMNDMIKTNESLSRLIDQCGGGYHVFNNKDQSNRDQVNELMEKIDKMVEKNEGSCYTNEMFKNAGNCFSTFWKKYKTHFIWAAVILAGLIVSAGVVCLMAGPVGGAAGAAAGKAVGVVTQTGGVAAGDTLGTVTGGPAVREILTAAAVSKTYLIPN